MRRLQEQLNRAATDELYGRVGVEVIVEDGDPKLVTWTYSGRDR